MNQINPLHIGAFLVALIAFLFFKLHGVKEELIQANSSYKTSEKLAVEVSSLKSVYAIKKKTQKAIDRVLTNGSLKEVDLDIKRNKQSIKINSKSIATKALNFLMGKILNSSYKITKLKIKSLSNEKASLEMEIQW
ncbi:hypothetical protein JHD49_03785 [Sulfurimonas sp. SAG-AH-194-C21]|nr:hypothetical protein [Sulfurimonas sp. SAG-AH-194-C21]MDF1883052.1 hypothetical protein [Sulfurimonas sp. SAG-AH-194-C21]